jgi:hypothetical protein
MLPGESLLGARLFGVRLAVSTLGEIAFAGVTFAAPALVRGMSGVIVFRETTFGETIFVGVAGAAASCPVTVSVPLPWPWAFVPFAIPFPAAPTVAAENPNSVFCGITLLANEKSDCMPPLAIPLCATPDTGIGFRVGNGIGTDKFAAMSLISEELLLCVFLGGAACGTVTAAPLLVVALVVPAFVVLAEEVGTACTTASVAANPPSWAGTADGGDAMDGRAVILFEAAWLRAFTIVAAAECSRRSHTDAFASPSSRLGQSHEEARKSPEFKQCGISPKKN